MKNTSNSNLFIRKTIFIKLLFSFIIFTIIGTISHEAGHLFISKLLGFKNGKIHYKSAFFGNTPTTDSLNLYNKKFRLELKNNIDFPDKKIRDRLNKSFAQTHQYILWGGPLQTMLTGTMGLIALFMIKRKNYGASLPLSIVHWLWVFIALFWLRQVANCFTMLIMALIKGKYGHSDEINLSEYYNLPPWTLNVITGAIGTYVLYYVIFKFIPPHQRLTFISAGLIGGIAGYILWLIILGPILLP